jgi:GntR family transcriptional regulator/MocR family aminotransferase
MAEVDSLLLSETRSRRSDGREGFILGFSGFEIEELTAAARRLGQAAARVVRILPG